jgi:hypothetical protein
MVPENKQNNEQPLTQIRNVEIDIIKGASNTEQIEAMQANAAQNAENATSSSNATAGEKIESSNEDLDNPAIRGI